MKRILQHLFAALLVVMTVSSCATMKKTALATDSDSKREFRGAWVQTVFQERYYNKTTAKCKAYLESLVETLYQTGFNAVIFQVRPEGDAFYKSNCEPWSRFLTGKQGKAPSPTWDPMEYLITLCHQRGMEFHAWINPYRQYASKSWNMDGANVYYQHPEWFVTFDGRLYLNPGLPESRAWIRAVVKDIVSRYDVDAIHMDDYFYPYPVAGETFNDYTAFATYGPVMGFDVNKTEDLGNFRRRSVNILIKSVNEDIKALKPWVRLGISPFGIYRNKASDSNGSNTNGTQCYDDLYADVLLWAKEGWVDYLAPQLYWEIGNKNADYATLCDWWADNTPDNCQLYIGQSIDKSLDASNSTNLLSSNTQFIKKINQTRDSKHIQGNIFWYAYQIEDNEYHVQDFLRQSVYTMRAMPYAFTNLSSYGPEKVTDLDATLQGTTKGFVLHLTWDEPATNRITNRHTRYYNVYRFARGESQRTNTLQHLYKQVETNELYDDDIANSTRYTYIVTPVDYYNNEGKGVKRTFNVNLK